MDNLSPKGQLRPIWGWLLNNKGFILNPFQILRDPGDGGGGNTPPPGNEPPPGNTPPPAGNAPPPAGNPPPPVSTGWKSGIRTDLRDSPFLAKFEDTPQGLEKAMESYGNLEKLLGHDKVPMPKGPDDKEGWARFNKAIGVPDKADGYGLKDASIPDSMKGMTFDKAKFAEIVHANGLTPTQAQGLWKTYTDLQVSAYNQHLDALQANLNKTMNALKQEWGDAYNTNVELGQNVINQFSGDKETADFLTAALLADPKGIKFLAKLGGQFSENKVGDFNVKRFAVSPEEAQNEIDKMTRDLEGPYMNQSNKFTAQEHAAAIERMNSLRAVVARAKG